MELAPNLQLILDRDFIHTSEIVETGKLHLVKSLDLRFPPIDPNLFVQFATASPKLSSLNLIKIENKTQTQVDVATLNSILQASQSTLKNFDGIQRLKGITGIQLPGFPCSQETSCGSAF